MNFNSFKLLTIVITLFSSAAFAQDGILSNLSYGARLGATVSNFSKEQPHTSARLGFMVGGLVEYSFSEKLSLQAEPSYLQQGGRFIRFSDDTRFGQFGGNNLYTTNSEVTIHTLDLPFLAKYKLPKFGDIQPNVVLGPAIGYTLGAENSYQTTFYNNQTFTTANAYRLEKSQYQPFQLGVTGGFGGEVSLGEGMLKRLMIDFRYRYGVTAAKKSYSYVDIFSVQGDLRTHTAFVTIGIGL